MFMFGRNKKLDGQHQQQITGCGGAAPAAAMRKGPWTEEEDAQLVRFVRLFGERRWDFLAKVSGLRGGGCIDPSPRMRAPLRRLYLRRMREGRSTEVHGQWRAVLTVCFLLPPLCLSACDAAPLRHRAAGLRRTGKSCRLRWVNYLHPDLRRGRITADEERLIVQLHAQWGSRWSRIARSLPGRTDNEIKNFWRTRTRKKALEERQHSSGSNKTAASPLSSMTTASCCPGSPNSGADTQSSSAAPSGDDSAIREGSGGDDAELEEASTATAAASQHEEPQEYCCTVDQLWTEIAAADAAASYVLDGWGSGHCYYSAAAEPPPMPSSPVWEYSSDYSLWRIDDEEYYREMLDAS